MRPILADAVDLARRALLALEPLAVGAYLGVIAEDESSATHRFEATLPGYRGWQWAVVVAAPPGADYATVSESALLPGPDALVAPEFVPWEQRVRPGDLAPGDLLAPPADDPRLVPGYVATGDPVVDEVAYEVGLGRTKVMSKEGREEAAERWYAEYGPDSEMAKAAPGTCGTCGFYLPLAGSLRAAFGVCGNAMGADGRVVHVAYGCGAHSDTVVPSGSGSPLYEAYDDAAIEMISLEPERAQSASRVAQQASAEPAGEQPAVEVTSDRSGGAVAEQAEDVSSAAVAEGVAIAESSAVSAETVTEWPTAASDSAESSTPGSNDAVSTAAGPGVVEGQRVDVAADGVIEPGSEGTQPGPDEQRGTEAESASIESVSTSPQATESTAASGAVESQSASDSSAGAGELGSADTRSAPVGASDSATDSGAAESDSAESNAGVASAAEPSAVESDSSDADPAESDVAGTDAGQSTVAATVEPASGSESGAPETSAAEPTGIEEAGAQAGSDIEQAGAAEARPEFPSSPRS